MHIVRNNFRDQLIPVQVQKLHSQLQQATAQLEAVQQALRKSKGKSMKGSEGYESRQPRCQHWTHYRPLRQCH